MCVCVCVCVFADIPSEFFVCFFVLTASPAVGCFFSTRTEARGADPPPPLLFAVGLASAGVMIRLLRIV